MVCLFASAFHTRRSQPKYLAHWLIGYHDRCRRPDLQPPRTPTPNFNLVLSCLVLSTPLQICHFTCHFPHTRHKRRRASSIDPLQIREHHRPARTLFNNINNILGSGFTLEHALSGRLRARYMLLSEPSFPTFECVVDSCQTGDVLLPCL